MTLDVDVNVDFKRILTLLIWIYLTRSTLIRLNYYLFWFGLWLIV